MRTSKDIKRNLVNHPPSLETQKDMEQIRAFFKEAVECMQALLPEGRERSLAMTKVEEAVVWSMASLARYDYDLSLIVDEDEVDEEDEV